MEIIKVGIWLEDVHFAHALSRGLARECRNMVFYLLEKPEDGADCDLILSYEETTEVKTIVMVRNPAEENVFGEPPYRIYRYKESETLVNDLLFIYFKQTGRNLEGTGGLKCKILLFAAASDSSTCTKAAICTGQMLERIYGCKCLYLNLCPLDQSKRYLSSEGEKSLLHLLYYLDRQKDFPLGTFISRGFFLDYINTSQINAYFDEAEQKLLIRLLKKIDAMESYDFLIIDIGNHWSRNNKQIMKQAFQMIFFFQTEDLQPEAYFLKLRNELAQRGSHVPILPVKILEDDTYEKEEEGLLLSKDTENIFLTSDGLLDLSKMQHFQADIAAVAKAVMEETGK